MFGNGSGMPDVVQVENNRVHSFTDEFPNAFTNLSSLGYAEHVEKFYESKIEGLKDSEGNVIASPRDLGPVGVTYRTDIFEEAGVDPASIETWEDYIEAGKTVTEHTGKAFLGTEGDGLLRIMLQQQGASYFTEDGKLDLTSPEAQNAAEIMRKMKDEGLITYADTVENIQPVNHAPAELEVRSVMGSEMEAYLLEDKPADQMLEDGEAQAKQ